MSKRSGSPVTDPRPKRRLLMEGAVELDAPALAGLGQVQRKVSYKYAKLGQSSNKRTRVSGTDVKYRYKVMFGPWGSKLTTQKDPCYISTVNTDVLLSGGNQGGIYSAIPMYAQKNSINGGTSLPIVCMSLTRGRNFVQGGNLIYSQCDICKPVLGSDGSVRFFPAGLVTAPAFNYLRANNETGTSYVTDWQPYKGDIASTFVSQILGANAVLKRTEIRLEAWGSRTKPTTYHVALVQFTDECNPSASAVTPTTLVHTDYNIFPPGSDGAKWWMTFGKKLIHHPLDADQIPRDTSMKVMWGNTFTIEPQANTDLDDSPQCVLKRYTVDLNRMCRYNWQNASSVTEDQVINNGYLSSNGLLATDVEPCARVYLMCWCDNYVNVETTSNAPISTDAMPSIGLDVINTFYVDQ